MSCIEELEHLRIPLEEIKSATNNFSIENFLGQGGFGPVYKGDLSRSEEHCKVAVKRLNSNLGQGQREFLMEIALLSSCKHENLASLVGFCDECDEKILVYKYESRGSLDKYLGSIDLTWTQRLQICIGAARGLKYLHNDVGAQHRILHRDIKSSNVLLDDNWEAKISDFGLSKIGPSNQQFTFLVSNACGTFGYVDPLYMETGILTKESDVYSFGVVLFEVLCGRPACMGDYEDERRFLARLAKLRYEEDRLDEIINPNLKEQMVLDSLTIFSTIAYQCLKRERRQRPTMGEVVEELQNALEHQLAGLRITRIGRWGGHGGNNWSFLIHSDYMLRKITIDHKDWIFSLIFTIEDSKGKLQSSKMFGGDYLPSGGKISEINLDADEEITGIKGTITVTTGWDAGLTVVESLSFLTNKTTHGPFGPAKGTAFSASCVEFALAGFYGCAGFYIDSIGIYLKSNVSRPLSW